MAAERDNVRQQIRRKLERLEKRMLSMLKREYRTFESTMVVKHLSGPTTPTSLSVRTGQLRRSMRRLGPVAQKGFRITMAATIGDSRDGNASTVRKRAVIHERGGTIRPKKARMLAIPTRRMRTRAGVAKVPGPREVSDLFVVKKGGKVFLARKTGKGGRKKSGQAAATARVNKKGEFKPFYGGRGAIEILFVLVPQVYIPPRLNFLKEWKAWSKTVSQKLSQEASKVLLA